METSTKTRLKTPWISSFGEARMGDTKDLVRSHSVETETVSEYIEPVPMNATLERNQVEKTEINLIHSLRVVAAFALGGAVLSGLTLGWIPALSAISVEEIG